MADNSTFRILVVGDVHLHWDSGSESAVRALAPDLLLFVGDYGDEAEECVGRIAEFCAEYDDVPNGRMSCAVLGNHEALKHALDPKLDTGAPLRQRKLLEPFNPMESPRHFKSVDNNNNSPVVLGGRPFSFGGPDIERFGHVPQRFGGIKSLQDSQQRMCRDIDSVNDKDSPLIFLSHNGPFGLGAKPADICGNDYEERPATGDHGDPDLRAAIDHARARGHNVPLVVFGHFHRNLQPMHGEHAVRNMVAADDDTVYVNAAFVPRIREVDSEQRHHFMSVALERKNWRVQKVDAIWCNSGGEICTETCYYDSKCGGLTNAV